MSEFKVTTGNLKRSANELGQVRRDLRDIKQQMERVAGSSALSGQASLARLASYIRQVAAGVGNDTVSLGSMQSALEEIAHLYEEADRRIAGQSSEESSLWERIKNKISDLDEQLRDYLKGALDQFCMLAGDPVNMSNGNYFLRTRDLMVRGFTPIIWERNYNGLEQDRFALGAGWRHNHHWQVSATENGWLLTQPDGSVRLFAEREEETGKGEFEALSGPPCRLLVREDRIEVIRERETLLFDPEGRILEWTQSPCERIRYRYEDDRLAELEGENGTFLRLSYDAEGLLTDAEASDGSYVHYEYDEGRLVKAQSAGACTEYGYDEAGHLTQIRGVDGKIQLHNIYDSKDRVTQQQLIGGAELKYEYLKDRTVLTWPDGTEVTYVFDSAFRHVRTIYHDSEESCTYNSRNQKTSFTDRLGRTTRYGYDPAGNLTSFIDPAGSRTSITYDGRGHVTAVKRPDGGRTVWLYTPDGLVQEQRDAVGGITRYSYNEMKLPASIALPNGTQMEIAYDEQGNMISCDADGVRIATAAYDSSNRRIMEQNGEGDIWRYAYDDAGRLTCVINPEGNERHFEYDEKGRVTRHTDYAGNVTISEYNDAGNPVLQTDVCGNVTAFSYDERQNLKEKRLPGGGVFTYAYDPDNRLCKVMRDGGLYREYEYDAVGNLTCERDALGHETRYEYDVCDRVVRISRADGTKRSFAYDACGRTVRETDEQGGERLYEYDLEGNLTARTDPDGTRTGWQYNAGGLVEKITGAEGREAGIRYGSCGRVKSIEIAGGRAEEYEYDAAGRLVKERHSDGFEETYTYDSCGNLTGIRDQSGSCRTARFDAMGRTVEVTDPRGNRTAYTYRPDGILTGILDAAGSSASYQYSPEGYLQKLVRRGLAYDAETGKMQEQESTTVYERDHWGRLLSETDPLGNTTSYTYDALDRVITKTDRMGRETRIEYDLAGNIRAVTTADGETSRMDHSPSHLLNGLEEAAGHMQIARDPAGRAMQVTGFDGTKTEFSYTDQGQLSGVRYPDKTEVQYRYDSWGRPVQMRCGALTISFAYDDCGRLISRADEKGSGTAWEYGPDGTVRKISFLQGGKAFKTCRYAYDACGNKTEVNWEYAPEPEQGSHNSYVYDALNRISEVYEDGTRVRKYSYDGFGNRICLEEKGAVTEYQYNRANQLVFSRRREDGEDAWKRTEYAYDPEGNQVRMSGPDGLWETHYDCRNHPVASESGTKSVRRQYSSLGQLLATALWERDADPSKECPGGSVLADVFAMDERALRERDIRRTNYLNDYSASADKNILLGLTESSGSAVKYLQDPFGMRAAWMDDDGCAQLLWTDELGSICAAAGRDGQIAEAERFDEFGNLPGTQKGRMPKESGLPQGAFCIFAGLMPDPAEGIYTAGMRRYDPAAGRFAQEDPMMRETLGVQDQNLYTYCFHQPMTLVDRDGCFPSLSDMYHGLKDFGNEVNNWCTSKAQDAWNWGSSKAQDAWNWGSSKAQDAWNWGSSKAQDAWNWGKSKAQDAWNWGSSKAQDAWNWGKSRVQNAWDRTVQRGKHIVDRGYALYKLYTDPEYHYNRNRYNDTPEDLSTVYEYDKNGNLKGRNGWEKLPDSANQYHVNTGGEQGDEAKYNKKFVKVNPDGSSSEVIICFPPGKEPYLVNDYLNGGTYNYYNPQGSVDQYILHFFYDMLPYYIYGNQKEDGGWRKKAHDGWDWVKEHLTPDKNRHVWCIL